MGKDLHSNIYLYHDGLIIEIHEGIGENLLPEDIEQGYVDYIMLYSNNVYDAQVMLTKPYSEFTCDSDVIQHLVDTEFIPDIEYEQIDENRLKELGYTIQG